MHGIVIIPTYNEKDTIAELIHQIFIADCSLHVLVVDDASPDGTGDIVEGMAQQDSRIDVIHRSGKLGFASAYIDGFFWALGRGVEIIFTMDADFSHHPKYLPLFHRAIQSCDIVVGSRYLHGVSVVNWPLQRLLLSCFANAYVRLITKLPVTDCTSGFRAYRAEALETILTEKNISTGYAFLVEVLLRAFHHGLKIGEIPIVFTERMSGKSKISKKILWESVWLPWRVKFHRHKRDIGNYQTCHRRKMARTQQMKGGDTHEKAVF